MWLCDQATENSEVMAKNDDLEVPGEVLIGPGRSPRKERSITYQIERNMGRDGIEDGLDRQIGLSEPDTVRQRQVLTEQKAFMDKMFDAIADILIS